MEMFLLDFAPQCCDAVNYLTNGQKCHDSLWGCYNVLRPVGAQLWFAWPLALGLPQEILIVVHWVLLALSVVLSTLSIRHWSTWIGCHATKWWAPPQFVASAAIHLIFFWPAMKVSLTDVPGGILALCGVWMLILSVGRERRLWLRMGIAGLAFGLAAWLRAFYLYPLIGAIALYLLSWVSVKPRRLSELALVIALVPVAIQFVATWHAYGTPGYIVPEMSNDWTKFHLSSNLAGYDTTLNPTRGYPWPSKCAGEGLLPSLANSSLGSATCLIGSRLDFYFGSYSPFVYQSGETPDRHWSFLMLAANLFALGSLAAFSLRGRGWLRRPMLAVTAFVWLSFGQALLLVPEQRFVMIVQIVAWLVTLGTLLAIFAECSARRRAAKLETASLMLIGGSFPDDPPRRMVRQHVFELNPLLRRGGRIRLPARR